MRNLLLMVILSSALPLFCADRLTVPTEQIKSSIKSMFDGKYIDVSAKKDFIAVFGNDIYCFNGFIKETPENEAKECVPMGDFTSKLLKGRYLKYVKAPAGSQQQMQQDGLPEQQPATKRKNFDPRRKAVEPFPGT